jgi:proteic killer suppression protein
VGHAITSCLVVFHHCNSPLRLVRAQSSGRVRLITLCVHNAQRYYVGVIRSFRDKDTEAIWGRRYVKKPSPELSRLAYSKLVLINAAESINDLRVPPRDRLEKLAGNRAGQYSVRVNDQWRICFTWSASGAGNVELVDYH